MVRLEELRLVAIDELADVRLALGGHQRLIGDLQAAVSEQPLREHRWAQLSWLLYRSGRQADALRAYRRLRELLADELGIAPSAELIELERAILMQAPQLQGAATVPRNLLHRRDPQCSATVVNGSVVGQAKNREDMPDGHSTLAVSRTTPL